MLPIPHPFAPDTANDSFFSLLYRFYFFDWLFADITRAEGLLERHAAWSHNLRMRKYLPAYLRRWSVLAMGAFIAGFLCDRVLEAQLAASCCFTGFSLTLPVMGVIVVSWLVLSRPLVR